MTVAELIAQLQKFPSDMDVMCEAQSTYEHIEPNETYPVASVDEYDISTFGYVWAQELVCRITFGAFQSTT